MNKDEYKAQFQEGVEKALDTARTAGEKAVVALQDFSDKSVIKFEIHQFDSKVKADYTKLGKLIADRFIANPEDQATRGESTIAAIIDEIIAFKSEILKRQELLAQKDAQKSGDK